MPWTMIREDPYLGDYRSCFKERVDRLRHRKKELAGRGKLSGFARGYEYYGLHSLGDNWIFREWLPAAEEVFFLCQATGWSASEKGRLVRKAASDDWEISLSGDDLKEEDHFKLLVRWNGGEGERIPAYCTLTHQDRETHQFTARVWQPGKYQWKQFEFKPQKPLKIYEAHIGMAPEESKVGSFDEFRQNTLPRIVKGGYNAVQLMALMEHPYYGSFGYQVSSFYAVSSRFGKPEELMALIDACHEQGIAVIMDLVHSHSVKNLVEGLSHQDGSDHAYFHSGGRGYHPAWDSRCFDYGKPQVLHFLLSNCAWWLNTYHLDGFRFDGVTSMLYRDHGLGRSFDHYDLYFDGNVDNDSICYLSMANDLIHEINPNAVTIAEDMSGMPGMARETKIGGLGFDYRLTMGIPDYWIKLLKEKEDTQWNVEEIWGILNNRRYTEKHIAYAESHDQALVGDKTIAFRLMDAEMYTKMDRASESIVIDRGLALHKIIRLLTFSLGGDGYLNFMGNEFGHPEWIDFPREGNGWSHHYARRQWSLADRDDLRYSQLGAFDKALLETCSVALKHSYAKKRLSHVSDQILVYTRGPLLFIFNLSPDRSYENYGFCLDEGYYKLILSTDSKRFGGWDRIPEDYTFDIRKKSRGEGVMLYLPARTGQVYLYESDS